jgi:hypothetical protein
MGVATVESRGISAAESSHSAKRLITGWLLQAPVVLSGVRVFANATLLIENGQLARP